MSDLAIKIEGLGKRFRIGQAAPMRSLKESFGRWLPRHRSGPQHDEKGGESDFWALKDVSFDVLAGEVVGIIGHNGAGKSTLLKILSQITDPTEGFAEVHGRIGSLLEVGTGFHPELTGRENVYLNGAILGMRQIEIIKKFDEIVAFAEIEKFIDTPVKHYSSGMYTRLAFAVAAHLEPEILIVDEVLAVGDVGFQRKCLAKMGEVAHAGRTVLLVSHNVGVIRTLCNRAVLLDKGIVAAVGPSDGVVDRYLSKAVRTSDACIELPDASGENPLGRATVLRLLGTDGRPKTQFRIFEPWRIVLEFEICRLAEHVIVAVGLVSFEGTPIATYFSAPQDLDAGKYQVEFDCNLPLSGQSFQFAVGLSSQERAFYYVLGVGQAAVSDAAVDTQPVRSSGAGIIATRDRPQISRLPKAIDIVTNAVLTRA